MMELFGKEISEQELKDKLAWALIYGGPSIVVFAIKSAAIAAGLIDRGVALRASMQVSRQLPSYKKKAWDTYKRTGSIKLALQEFF